MKLLSIYSLATLSCFLISFVEKSGWLSNTATCKSCFVRPNRDTINCTDYKNFKQGIWFEEDSNDHEYIYKIGTYKDGFKWGIWNTYSDADFITEKLNYTHGELDKINYYYSLGKLQTIGRYFAWYFDNKYDTIEVIDPVTDSVFNVRIKQMSGSVKHGDWIYFGNSILDTIRIDHYFWDEIQFSTNKTHSNNNLDSLRKIELPHNNSRKILRKKRRYNFPEN